MTPREGDHKFFEVEQKFYCESARFLPKLPDGHPCRRLHGHSFEITLTVTGPLDPARGWVIDFEVITAAFKPLADLLDHAVLNDVPGLENPTSEILARFIYDDVRTRLPALTLVSISETRSTRVRYPV